VNKAGNTSGDKATGAESRRVESSSSSRKAGSSQRLHSAVQGNPRTGSMMEAELSQQVVELVTSQIHHQFHELDYVWIRTKLRTTKHQLID